MDTSFYYILFLIVTLSILFSWIRSESFFNPTSIFISWWGFFVFVSSLNLIGMRLPSMRTYNLIFVAMICFSIGSITFMNPKPAKSHNKSPIPSIFSKQHNPKILMFFIFQLIITLALLWFFGRTLHLLATLEPGTIRGLVYSEDGIFESHNILVNYILRPSIFISIFISISGVFLGVFKKRYMLIAFFNLLIYSLVVLGRSSIFMLMLSLIFGIIYVLSVKKIYFRKKYVFLFTLPFVFLIYMSIFRKSSNPQPVLTMLTNYSVWYLTGPFTAFDYFINTYRPNIDFEYSYFRGVVAGFEQMLFPFIKRTFSFYKDINSSFHEITAPFRSLGGPATHHNSHFTMLYTFYRDAGIIGIMLYSYLLGMIDAVVFNRFRNNTSIFNFTILILLTYLSVIGTMRWELRYSWGWLIIIGSFFVIKKFIVKKITILGKNV